MKKIGIIINPFAKKNKKMNINLVDLYKGIGGDLVEVKATRNLGEVYLTAEEFKRNGISYLGICGGDGTLHNVISRFMHVYKEKEIPPIVILKGGTMDTTSRSINLKGKGPEILKKLITRIKSGHDIKIYHHDILKVDDKYGFLFGLGISSNFLNEYYKGGDAGPWKAAKVVGKMVCKGICNTGNTDLFKRLNAKVIVDGKVLPFNDILGILVGTIENIGIGFRALYRAREKDFTFHVFATGIKPIQFAMNILRFKNGKKINLQNHFDDIARELIVIGSEKYQYTMDGDLYEAAKELKLTAGPQIKLVHV